MQNQRAGAVLLAAVSAFALSAASASAQAVAPAGLPPAQSSTGVAEVVVTAQRREESLQKVPIAITVVSGDQLAARQTYSAESLVEQVPSLTFRKGTTNVNSALNIRGVGTISFASGSEPAVSTVVDGVVLARPGQATFDFLDVERIEVLRGPQGTLFGKNASAGLLNVVTRRPTSTLTGFAEVGEFEKNETRVRGQVSGRITDTLRGTFSALYGHFDGSGRNVYDGKPINGYDHLGARGKLEWTPNERTTVTFIGDYLNEVDNGSADVIGKVTNTPFNNLVFLPSISPVVPNSHNRDINNNVDPKTTDSNGGASAQVDFRLGGGYTLTSITAYRHWNNEENRDGDFLSNSPAFVNAGAAAGNVATRDVGFLHFDQYTEELRLASAAGKRFDWQAGLFLFHTSQDNTFNRFATACTASTLAALSSGIIPCAAGQSTVVTAANGTAAWNTQLTNYAFFGQGTYRFTDRFRVIGGVRWSHDRVQYTFNRAAAPNGPGVNPPFSAQGATEADGPTGRISAEYDVDTRVTAYVTYAHGYKGPAINVFFNMQPNDRQPLSPETSEDVEAGLKTRLFANRVVLNVAAFYEKFDGYQTNSFDTVAGQIISRLINAGTVSSRGIEADYLAKPIKNLSLSGGAAYIDARIDKFNCPVGAPASCSAVDGHPLPYAPRYKVTFAADYRVVTPESLPFDVGLNTGYSWQSKTQFDINQSPDGLQKPYGLWDASVALLDKRDRFRVTFVARNLTDQYYTEARVVGAQVRFQVPRDSERYVGVVLRANFGE